MDFFEKIGEKINDAGQTTIQKTKDITTLNRLNNQISNEERWQAGQYKRIGEMFFEANCDNPYEPYTEIVEAIKESKKKVADLRRQVLLVKELVVCPKCGTENSTSAAFCMSCGGPLPVVTEKEVKQNKIFCVKCGKAIDKNASFCVFCGSSVK